MLGLKLNHVSKSDDGPSFSPELQTRQKHFIPIESDKTTSIYNVSTRVLSKK